MRSMTVGVCVLSISRVVERPQHRGGPHHRPGVTHGISMRTRPSASVTYVLPAILNCAVGTGGTVVMVLGAQEFLPFDVHRTPADPGIGALAEVLGVGSGDAVDL